MIGARLGDRYEIQEELGRGGMGIVYRAWDPLLRREVAVKLLSPALLAPVAEERFRREAQIVAQMDHPAIVAIYDLGQHDGSLFLVMPILSGRTLRSLIRERTLRLGDVLDVGIQVAEALDYSHSRGVIHRDIKPENIMISRDDLGTARGRVMDFGLAVSATDPRITKEGTLVGTLAYFSPEQASSHNLDARSDIYSWATVLYECLVGEPPFSGEGPALLYRIVHEIPRAPRAMAVDISEELEEIILRCLEKDPGKRPQRAGEVAEALSRYRSRLAESDRSKTIALTPRSAQQLERPSPSPFIGRQKEFAQLQGRLNAALGGQCQLVLVGGEPGVGKSRLIEELEKLAKARTVRVLHGRFAEHDRAFDYQGFCEVIQDYFRPAGGSGPSAEHPDFSDLTPDLASLFPVLTEISEFRSAALTDTKLTPPRDAARVEDRMYVFELLARTLGRIASGRPLLLVLENLHRADVSIDALQYIVRRLSPTQTLIVGTYLTTEVDRRHPLRRLVDGFADDPRFESMVLGPLSASEQRGLVESLLGGGSATEALAVRLFEATEGNPFFAKALVGSLIVSGAIAKDERGVWSLSGQVGPSSQPLPATIQQAVERRIERLPNDQREVLLIASLFGKSFGFRDLEAVAEGIADLDGVVERLVRDGLLEEERGSRADRLTFSSGIARDVLYDGLSRRKRRTLHRRYAVYLETHHAGRLERVYPELLHHYSRGDVPEKTVSYGLLQARKSLGAFSPEDAARAARMVLEFLEDEEWAGDRSLEGEARELLAMAHRMAGNVDGALKEAEGAIRVFDREGAGGRAASTMLLAAEAAWQGWRADDAKCWVERGIERARSAEHKETLAKLLSLAATVANLRGEYQKAKEYLEEAKRLGMDDAEIPAEEELPLGGRLVVAFANAVLANEPGQIRLNEEDEVLGNVYQTLVTTDAHGNLVPWLCEKWEVLNGGRSLLVTTRKAVRFSDGCPLTSNDVKTSFERAIRASGGELPPAFAAIQGASELVSGQAHDLTGLIVHSDEKLEIRLVEPLPIYPALLTDSLTGICRAASTLASPAECSEKAGVEIGEPPAPLGTGPFAVASRASDRIVLRKNPAYWRGTPARLDEVEIRTSLSASAIAAGFRAGEFDIARDLLPEDLEDILREARWRAGFVESPKKNTYFVLFNCGSQAVAQPEVRRALAGVLRTRDLVWRTLGRFAHPATGLIPPGILGHDPGRKPDALPRDKAMELLRAAGCQTPLRLHANIHPLLQDRYGSLTKELLEAWAELGVEVSAQTCTMADYLARSSRNEGIDLQIGRWNADYDDADNFTLGLFHSGLGVLRAYYSSPQTDLIGEAARQETRPAVREALYRKFETALLDLAVVVPLFHEIDYRVVNPNVRGLRLGSTPPYVRYQYLAKASQEGQGAATRRAEGGVVQVAMTATLHTLDPSLTATVEQAEVIPNIFETLTRDAGGARIVPWLARECTVLEGGCQFRFRLREDVRFHDGRRLSARDVRYSFERLLQNRSSDSRWLLSPIRGAAAVISGETSDLAGFQMSGPHEFVIELDKPISFFPALLTHPSCAVVPEGTGGMGGSMGQGCVGTGPFRVTRFEPDRRLDLERNSDYWRKGLPRAEGLVFRFGLPPQEIASDFRSGRLSIASDLMPADVEALRHDPQFAPTYRETPRLSTYFVVFNANRPPLSDRELRRWIYRSVDVTTLVRRTLGMLAIPAHGLIPPGLLGHEAPSHAGLPPVPPQTMTGGEVELTAAVHPVFFGEYADFARELLGLMRQEGFIIRVVNTGMTDYWEARGDAIVDLVVGRWIADYPDADTFSNGVLHSKEGFVGRMCGSPEIDALVERGRTEINPRARHLLYRRVEEIIAGEARLLPLFHEPVYRFARPEVDGLTINFSPPVVAYEKLLIRR